MPVPMLDPYVLVRADIARQSGLTSARIGQLNEVLRPKRLPNGEYRYRVDVVEHWLAQRAKGTP